MKRTLRLVVLASAMIAGCSREGAERAPVLVFSAASLADALGAFERELLTPRGLGMDAHFAGSSLLGRQILRGAPADLLIAAHPDIAAELVESGSVPADAVAAILTNRLVIVGRRGDLPLRDADDLLRVASLALADPETAPAGRYGRAWLESRGLWARLEPRVVPTRDVRAALGAVASGHLPMAIVYATDAASGSLPVLYEVPVNETPPITYVAVLIGERPAARRVFELVRGREAADVFARYGFEALEPVAGEDE